MGLFDTDLILQELESNTTRETCQLLGNAFGYCIQLTLGVVAFTSLVYKRFRVPKEKRRDWDVWGRDVSKQAFGAGAAHFWNMVFSVAMADGRKQDNPCIFYLVNFLVDSLFGCLGNFGMLWAVTYFAEKMRVTTLRTGEYGDPPKNSVFALQLVTWLWIVTAVKIVLLYVIVMPFSSSFYAAIHWILNPVDAHPKLELVIVMVLIPLVVNIIVFWVTDNFLMSHERSSSSDCSSAKASDEESNCFSCCDKRKNSKKDDDVVAVKEGPSNPYVLVDDTQESDF